ncbi:MAG: CHAT domain-containing protein [Deltaproteobacteria bacterium]|nr:CHAT domain-containing protein [Deltaproteobacteria bacterium]
MRWSARNGRLGRWLRRAALGFVLGHAAQTRVQAQPTPGADDALEACRQTAAQGPVDRAAAMCFYAVARSEQRWDEAQRELERLVEQPDATPWARLGLAVVLADRGQTLRAAQLVAPHVETLPPGSTVGDRATLLANYGQWMRTLARHSKAEHAFERLIELGRREGIPQIEATGQVELGYTILQRGGDIVRVLELYDAGIPAAIARGSYMTATHGLRARASLWMSLGKYERARSDYAQLLEMAQRADDAYVEAFARVQLVSADLSTIDLREQPLPAALRTRIDAARALSERTGQTHAIAKLLCLEADIRAGLGQWEAAAEGFHDCAAAYEAIDARSGRLSAQIWEAQHLSLSGEHEAARALIGSVDDEVHALGIRGTRTWSGYVRMVAAWRAGERDQALEVGHRVFDDIELDRDVQVDESDRAQIMSRVSAGYYFMAGSLLAESADDRQALETAFGTIERMRARALLDGLRRTEAEPHDPDDPDEQRWRAALRDIADVQRAVLAPSISEDERRGLLDRLVELERHERVLRGVLGRAQRGLGRLLMPRFPGLDEVQAALRPNEAVLSYQLADHHDSVGGPEGGSWLWSITRDAVRVHPIAERRVLDRQLGLAEGLFAARDGREDAVMSQLHRDVLAPALSELGPEIDRLVIVPDGSLWSLPFAALRAEPEAPPVVTRYSINVVPSVTSWMRWRTLDAQPAPGLLALAQPQLVLGSRAATWRSGLVSQAAELGSLPRAKDEVETITALWGAGPSHAEVGETASERFLKGSELERYGLLHFATHAVMDRAEPERSAVILAPGDEDEDGLLQAREIARLSLDGKVVVLSACSGASGAFVRGEGVMSLAQAFLQGGAQAVVASRWPLADADALALFQRLYLHLDEGRTLSVAMAMAQRELIEQGAPAAAWAGVVVLGRGDLVLVPRPSWWPWRRTLLVVGALLCLVIAGVTWRRAQRRSRA